MARDPGIRIRDVATCVGVTERAAHRLLCDLAEAGYLERHRVGRRNSYEVRPELPLRHPLESGHEVGAILSPLLENGPAAAEAPA